MLKKIACTFKIKWMIGAFLVVLMLVAGLNYFSYQLRTDARQSNAILEHTNDVHHAIDSMKISFEQADFEQREQMAYGATGSLVMRGKVWTTFDHLAQLTEDNPAQQTRLEGMKRKIGRRFEIFDSLIRIAEQQGTAAAVQQSLKLRTLDDLRDIENDFTAVRDQEWQLYYERMAIVRNYRQRISNLNLAVNILVYLAIIFSGFISIKTVCSKTKAAQFYKSQFRQAKRTANKEILLDEELAEQIMDILEEGSTIKEGLKDVS